LDIWHGLQQSAFIAQRAGTARRRPTYSVIRLWKVPTLYFKIVAIYAAITITARRQTRRVCSLVSALRRRCDRVRSEIGRCSAVSELRGRTATMVQSPRRPPLSANLIKSKQSDIVVQSLPSDMSLPVDRRLRPSACRSSIAVRNYYIYTVSGKKVPLYFCL